MGFSADVDQPGTPLDFGLRLLGRETVQIPAHPLEHRLGAALVRPELARTGDRVRTGHADSLERQVLRAMIDPAVPAQQTPAPTPAIRDGWRRKPGHHGNVVAVRVASRSTPDSSRSLVRPWRCE